MYNVEKYGMVRLINEYTQAIIGDLDDKKLNEHTRFLEKADEAFIKELAINARNLLMIDCLVKPNEVEKLVSGDDPKKYFDKLNDLTQSLFKENELRYYHYVIRQDLGAYVDYKYDITSPSEAMRRVRFIRETLNNKGEDFIRDLAKAIEYGYENDKIKKFKNIPKEAYQNEAKLSQYFDEYLKKVQPSVFANIFDNSNKKDQELQID